MRDKQNKDDVKPRITTTEGEEVKPAAVQGNETDKPIVGTPRRGEGRQADETGGGKRVTRDDGDNDDKGELA